MTICTTTFRIPAESRSLLVESEVCTEFIASGVFMPQGYAPGRATVTGVGSQPAGAVFSLLGMSSAAAFGVQAVGSVGASAGATGFAVVGGPPAIFAVTGTAAAYGAMGAAGASSGSAAAGTSMFGYGGSVGASSGSAGSSQATSPSDPAACAPGALTDYTVGFETQVVGVPSGGITLLSGVFKTEFLGDGTGPLGASPNGGGAWGGGFTYPGNVLELTIDPDQVCADSFQFYQWSVSDSSGYIYVTGHDDTVALLNASWGFGGPNWALNTVTKSMLNSQGVVKIKRIKFTLEFEGRLTIDGLRLFRG